MRRLFISVLLLGAIVLSGCGSSSSSSSKASSAPSTSSSASASTPASSASPSAAVKLSADPSGTLKYNTKSLSAKAGKVTVQFTNSSPVAHNVTIASPSGNVLGATPTFQGGTKALTLNLKPGTYTFYCSVPGHRQAGMQGTLVVK